MYKRERERGLNIYTDDLPIKKVQMISKWIYKKK